MRQQSHEVQHRRVVSAAFLQRNVGSGSNRRSAKELRKTNNNPLSVASAAGNRQQSYWWVAAPVDASPPTYAAKRAMAKSTPSNAIGDRNESVRRAKAYSPKPVVPR